MEKSKPISCVRTSCDLHRLILTILGRQHRHKFRKRYAYMTYLLHQLNIYGEKMAAILASGGTVTQNLPFLPPPPYTGLPIVHFHPSFSRLAIQHPQSNFNNGIYTTLLSSNETEAMKKQLCSSSQTGQAYPFGDKNVKTEMRKRWRPSNRLDSRQ